MIISVTLKDSFAKRVGSKKPKKFNFKTGVNLLVGPNGSGKSTVLEAIYEKSCRPFSYAEVETSGPVGVYYFDLEKGNVRTKNTLDNDGLAGFQVMSHFRSHGQVNKDLVKGLLDSEKIRDGVSMLDEPDQALDYDGIISLSSWLSRSKAKQIIVSVHNPLLVLDPSFHVIEMRRGYCKKMRNSIRELVGAS